MVALSPTPTAGFSLVIAGAAVFIGAAGRTASLMFDIDRVSPAALLAITSAVRV
jgi:hypothetical protein